MNTRLFKQIFYGGIFLIIIIGIISIFYFSFRAKPSCFDGKQNQGEEGIDCGGPCAQICFPPDFRNIEVLWTKLLPTDKRLILISKIQNPNAELGAYDFDYEFSISKNNQVLKTVNGKSYIYAQEVKYIVEFIDKENIDLNSSLNLSFKNISWTKAEKFKKPNIILLDKKYLSDKDFNHIIGKIKNNDFVLLKNIKIIANVYNENNLILSSVNTINQLDVGETKSFDIVFPLSVNLDSAQTEIVIEAKK